ncbi:DNA adenine methylase [Clostridium perfringens]|uniref:DNA adenine methylase n=1 Tax=Clostridium perfringens TaxID=1502 RepID=UPI0028556601|nr:DNA adenine methylase [Clostridium perfringens]ELC8408034.1 DNA adenine methylase [Clostridium perfringens]
MEKYLRTQEILNKFDLSRQTLYRWIRDKEISEPSRDWKNWRQWTEENIKEIQDLINRKIEKKENNSSVEKVFFEVNNRRYLGSKYKLLDFITSTVEENCNGINSVADIFGGTGVVANKFNQKGKAIIVNDILLSNYYSYLTWFGNETVDIKKITNYISEFNNKECRRDNYVSNNFGGTYFTIDNAKKIGYIREKINQLKIKKQINDREEAILITSLIYAMDKVANTCGHYDAYRRNLDSTDKIKLLVPHLSKTSNNGNNSIYKKDANELVRNIYADLVYIDTPYNSRQYGDAYHLLENIAEWKKPKVEGVAKKMIDRVKNKSLYCTNKATEAFNDLILNINAKYILVSYNNMAQKGVGRSNAKISNEEIISILEKRGDVKVFSTDYKVFTTGSTNIKDHKELLYLCKCK